MNKRSFLKTATAGIASLPSITFAGTDTGKIHGPALLTVTGAVGRANRGPLDPALDQMMLKQKLAFNKAYAFDYAGLDSMPKLHIQPTLEYDSKPHKLSGPLLIDVLRTTGARLRDEAKVLLRAIDGYAIVVSVSDLHKYRFILATRLDGKPMPLGGLGPLWAVYEADRFAEMRAKPLNERFGLCPWGLYHINLEEAG